MIHPALHRRVQLFDGDGNRTDIWIMLYNIINNSLRQRFDQFAADAAFAHRLYDTIARSSRYWITYPYSIHQPAHKSTEISTTNLHPKSCSSG